MKRSYGILLTAALLLMTTFLGLGYATLTDSLTIIGSAHAEGKPYKGVYIKSVEVIGTQSAANTECDYVLPTNHVSTVDATTSGGSVTYKITVHNNTEVTHWYVGPKWENDYGQNALIGTNGGIGITTKDQIDDGTQSFDSDDWIPPDTERVFYATYTYGANAQTECRTLVNFHFDVRMDAVHDEFLAVLNNVKSSSSYEQIKYVFEQQYAENGSTAITTESHPEVFASLFEDLYQK